MDQITKLVGMAEIAKEHLEVLGDYADALPIWNSRMVIPISELPHPKEKIKRALLYLITSEPDMKEVNGLIQALIRLATAQNEIMDILKIKAEMDETKKLITSIGLGEAL